MPRLTPGAHFLLEYLFVPSLLHYGVLAIACWGLKINAPWWLLAPLAIVLVPTRHIAATVYTYLDQHRQAWALGARLPPAVQSGTFANRALLKRMKDAWQLGYPGDTFWELVEEYGRVFNFRILFFDNLFTNDPNDVKRMLTTDFDNFQKGERFRFAMSSVLGSGVFNSDGEMWKFHRTMARPFFSRDRVTDLQRFDRHIQNAIGLFEERLKTGYAIDFQDLAQRLTMDIASDFLFGTSVDSLNVRADDLPQPYDHPAHAASLKALSKHPSNAFSEAFMAAQLVAAGRERVGWIWPLFEIFEDKSVECMKVVNRFIEPIVRDAVGRNAEKRAMVEASSVNEKPEIGDDDTFLDYLASKTSDMKILKDQALNVLIAGRDTMAGTLSFMFALLSAHPAIQQRLKEEVLESVGPTNLPTFEDVKNMKYLRAVINETLRVLPAVPWDVRECQNGAVWPPNEPGGKPIYVPPGSAVAYGILMMHTNEEFWGPDAAKFDPDRFLDDRKNYILANPFIFMPFNAGPRICLGQQAMSQLAYNQLSLITIRLLQAFSSFTKDDAATPPEGRVPEDWKHHKGKGRKAVEPLKPKVSLTMSCAGGMWLKAQPTERA